MGITLGKTKRIIKGAVIKREARIIKSSATKVSRMKPLRPSMAKRITPKVLPARRQATRIIKRGPAKKRYEISHYASSVKRRIYGFGPIKNKLWAGKKAGSKLGRRR